MYIFFSITYYNNNVLLIITITCYYHLSTHRLSIDYNAPSIFNYNSGQLQRAAGATIATIAAMTFEGEDLRVDEVGRRSGRQKMGSSMEFHGKLGK
jgi:hypothetical protein